MAVNQTAVNQTEAIRPDEEPAWKAGVPIRRDCEFESHRFRLTARGQAATRNRSIHGKSRAALSSFDTGRPGTPTGRAARLKPERMRVQLSPWAQRWGSWSSVGGAPRGRCTHLGTVRQSAERRSSNLRVCGFESRLCHSRGTALGGGRFCFTCALRASFALRPGGVIGKHATLRTSCPLRRGSSSLPLVTVVVRQVGGLCPDSERDITPCF